MMTYFSIFVNEHFYENYYEQINEHILFGDV